MASWWSQQLLRRGLFEYHQRKAKEAAEGDVAVIDFLGQATELAKWDFLPDTPGEVAQFVVAVRNTFGRILVWREEFERLFHLWLSEWQPPGWVVQTADGGEVLRKFQAMSIGFSHFSDTIVVYSPLQNTHGHLNLGGTFAFIVTCRTLMLAGLNQKAVFRGAIELGMAARFPQTDLYGPALAKAHYLESKVAEYPRIVVGPKLIAYLQTHRHNHEDTGPARASLCLRLLTRDDDGCWIVDYLSDEFDKIGTKPDLWPKLRSDANDFVQAELTRFRDIGDKKLVERYERLAAYFRSHGLG